MKNTIIGTATVTAKTFKVNGKKYELTEKAQAVAEKLDLNGRTALFATDKDGKIAIIRVQGSLTYKEKTPRYGKEGEEYLADYVTAIGYPCQLKESDGDPFLFTLACNEGKEKTEFMPMKVWGELGERAKVDLKTPDGEKAPKIWVEARKGSYKGKSNYTVIDYGVITD